MEASLTVVVEIPDDTTVEQIRADLERNLVLGWDSESDSVISKMDSLLTT